MTRAGWLLALLSTVPMAAVAGPAQDTDTADAAPETEVERITGPVEAEVEAFHAAKERYATRANELQADTRAFVERLEADERARLGAGYDQLLYTLNDDEQNKRLLAIARFETFLDRHDDVAYASEVRLRLAELYTKRAEEAWFANTTEYFRLMDEAGDDLDALERLEDMGSPQLDLGPVVALLDRIVQDNRGLPRDDQYQLLDIAYYMLAFSLNDANSAQVDERRARAMFRELVEVRPDSEYAAAAHLVLGNDMFDRNQLETAIAEFEAVLESEHASTYRDPATYQLAWSWYKLNEYEKAMGLFIELLDRSERLLEDNGRRSDYAPDAIANLALSLADISDKTGETPLEAALRFFEELDEPRSFEWDVLVELADVLEQYARPQDALDIYAALQSDPRFRLRPENPDFQHAIVRILSTGFDADLAAAGQARLDMTQRYSEGTDWWTANRNHPEALANARRYNEGMLLEVAIEMKVRAQESGLPEHFALAADKYREYLDRFPVSDDYYANQWQLADALFRAEKYAEAESEYRDLVAHQDNHGYGDGAAFLLMSTLYRTMESEVGPPDQPWTDAPVERIYTSVGGKEMNVRELAPAQKAYIDAVDAVLSRSYGEPVDGIDVAALVEEQRHKLMYLPGQLLHYAGRFDDSRPRLEALVRRFPATDEAAYAATLLMNSYNDEGDLAAVRNWSREFASLALGATAATVAEKQAHFRDAYEKASYNIGYEASQAGEFQKAADAFLSFVDEFPRSANVPAALMSAGHNFMQLGAVTKANTVYERFINEFPDHPDTKPFYYSIASNYESTFELDKAIGYYQRLVDQFPDYVDSPNALYMTAFLKVGLGDHLGAARGYERYARDYPERADREEVHFRAGEQYELADKGRAVRFYQGFLKEYGLSNPDRAIETQYRISQLLDEQGRDRASRKELGRVLELFTRAVGAGADIGVVGRDRAAEAAFPPIQEMADAILARELVGDESKDADTLAALQEEVEALRVAVDAYAGAYLSFEYTTAAMYLHGRSLQHFAALGLSLEPPESLPEEMIDAYWELLEDQVFPLYYEVEDAAVAKFEQIRELAASSRSWSDWVAGASTALNEIRPMDFPAQKPEVMGEVDATFPPEVEPTPLDPDDATAEASP